MAVTEKTTLEGRLANIDDGDEIVFPHGTTVLTQPVVVKNKRKVTIKGKGDAKIIYRGPPTKGIFDYVNTDRCKLMNLHVMNGGDDVTSFIRLGSESLNRTATPTACLIEDIFCEWDGNPGTKLTDHGLMIDNRDYSNPGVGSLLNDQNNDLHVIRNVNISSAKRSGFNLWGCQIYNINFDRCDFRNIAHHYHGQATGEGWPGPQYGVHSEYGGNFVWNGGSLTGCSANFYLQAGANSVRIIDQMSEHSKQLLKVGSTGSLFGVLILGGRFDGKLADQKLFPVIDYFGQGPIIVMGVNFTNQNSELPRVKCWSPTAKFADPDNGFPRNIYMPGTAFIVGNQFISHKAPVDGEIYDNIVLPYDDWDHTVSANMVHTINKADGSYKQGYPVKTDAVS
jgi:hypothetical protein